MSFSRPPPAGAVAHSECNRARRRRAAKRGTMKLPADRPRLPLTPPHETRREEQIPPPPAMTEGDAPPADAELLARLRAQSTEAFTAARPAPRRRFPTLLRRARWLAAAAAVVIATLGLYVWLSPLAFAAPLGEVL